MTNASKLVWLTTSELRITFDITNKLEPTHNTPIKEYYMKNRVFCPSPTGSNKYVLFFNDKHL